MSPEYTLADSACYTHANLSTFQYTMSHRHLIVSVLIGFAGLAALTVLAVIQTRPESGHSAKNEDSYRFQPLPVPAPGEAGRYKGRLEMLALAVPDLPSEFGPYTTDAEFAELQGNRRPIGTETGRYVSPHYINAERSFAVDTTLYTQATTADAVEAFNEGPLLNPATTAFPTVTGTLTSLSQANNYQHVTKVMADGTQSSWLISVIDSNLRAAIQITAPPTFTMSDLELIMIRWGAKLLDYLPATAAELRAEAASIKP